VAAIGAGVEFIAVDNFDELDLLANLTKDCPGPTRILLRLNPGVDVRTHGKIATGVINSKFGFPLWTGDALRAFEQAASLPGIEVAGYHAHLGSQLFDAEAPILAVRKILEFASTVRDIYGFSPAVVSPGGGLGIDYDGTGDEVDPFVWFKMIGDAVAEQCHAQDLPLPELIFEPGRTIVGPAGVTLYTVGARKDIDRVRKYVSIDGGMADNIRPSLYDAVYTACLASRFDPGPTEVVTIAGRYCESGDLLIEDISLPRLSPGDLLAVPATGAYCIPMASNYNMVPRPAVVLVRNGKSRILRRRETLENLLSLDALPHRSSSNGDHVA
jgi:diaminopimelate decarboxylase